MKCLYIMCGMAFSGKTTLAKKLCHILAENYADVDVLWLHRSVIGQKAKQPRIVNQFFRDAQRHAPFESARRLTRADSILQAAAIARYVS
jgi:shikimate kinase